MPRIRTVKPEFFQHEALFEAEKASGLPLRIAFVGLWTQADRAGRFEWRPSRLKLNILPYDNLDFPAVLSALETHGFIRRYDVDGKSFGCIPSWEKHQTCHVREPGSTIPAPDDDGPGTGPAPDKHQSGPSRNGMEGKGRERKEGTREDARATPDGLNLQAWTRWEAYRHDLRKPIRPASADAAMRALAAFGADQAAVVEQSVANGWQGLFALKPANGSAFPPKPSEAPGAIRVPTAEQRRDGDRKAIEASARSHGIDPRGLTESQINDRIWQASQAHEAASA